MSITIEDIAKACHEANRALCSGVGDNSQSHWDHAEEWQRMSALQGVKFAVENPDVPDSAQHDAWCFDKIKDGWVYGIQKTQLRKLIRA